MATKTKTKRRKEVVTRVSGGLVRVCCEDFASSLHEGSGSRGAGSLIGFTFLGDGYQFDTAGVITSPICRCPWCGRKVGPIRRFSVRNFPKET